MKRICILLKQGKMHVLLLFVLSIIAGVLPLLLVRYESNVINAVISIFNKESHNMVADIAALMIVLLASECIPIFKEHIKSILRLRYEEEYNVSIAQKVFRLPYEKLERIEITDQITRISKNIESNAADYVIQIFELVTVLLTISGYLFLVFSASTLAGIVFVILFVFLLLFASKAARAFYKMNEHFTQTERKVTYLDSLVNTKEYVYEKKLFDYTDNITQKRNDHLLRQRNVMRKYDYKLGISYSAIDTVGYWCTLVNIVSLIPSIVSGTINVGVVVAIVRASLNMNLTMQGRIRETVERLIEQRQLWKEYDELMGMDERNMIDTENYLSMSDFKLEKIEFRHVSFEYPNGARVLNDINLTMMGGKHYAMVGENGSGKSTMIKLLLGLYKPVEGQIFINGRDLSCYTEKDIAGMFSVVFQDFSRYSLQIDENIVFDRKYSEEMFLSAIKGAELMNLLDKLEQREKTILGQSLLGGIDISGGEWQKIAIARALYANGKMLILDEPTASLDPITESKLYEKYHLLTSGKMSLFISHRLASTTLADEIIVLSKGRVKEIGNHNELMRDDTLYRKMYLAQRRWYFDDEA